VDPVQRGAGDAHQPAGGVVAAGFMGAAYYIIPEEADRELYSEKLAVVQWAALVITGVVAIAGFHMNWWEGRKFLEIPRPLDFLVVIDVLLFIFNVGMTAWNGRRYTTTSIVLLVGLVSARCCTCLA
jgi:nitric oxide reductase subunit B